MSKTIKQEGNKDVMENNYTEYKKTEVADFLKKLQELEKARSDWRFKRGKE